MSLPFIDGAQLQALLSMDDAITALEGMFRSSPLPTTPPRSAVEKDDGQLLVMPSWGRDFAGVKIAAIKGSNRERGLPLIQGIYVLFAGDTLKPIATFDAAPLTALRTAAVSGLATRYLARDDAQRVVVFGAGVQAESHALAMAAVRDVSDIAFVGRSDPSVARFVGRLSSQLPARVGSRDDISNADIVCTCTTTDQPLFDGSLLPPGCHVNAIGTHQPNARELDTAAIVRSRVVVETFEAAFAEAGELVLPLQEGAITREHVVAELAGVTRGTRVRESAEDITVFKSVGIGSEDLAVAAAAYALS